MLNAVQSIHSALVDAPERLVDLTKALARKLDFVRNDPGALKDIEELSDVRSGL